MNNINSSRNTKTCERCTHLLNKISNIDNRVKNIVSLMDYRENRLKEQQLAKVHKD